MNFAQILKRTDIFYDLDDEQLDLVAELCHELHFRMGEMIFHEQSATDELYVIVQGEVEIIVDPSIIEATPVTAQPVTVVTMRAGQAFGEIALVDQGLRSAGARSASFRTRRGPASGSPSGSGRSGSRSACRGPGSRPRPARSSSPLSRARCW